MSKQHLLLHGIQSADGISDPIIPSPGYPGGPGTGDTIYEWYGFGQDSGPEGWNNVQAGNVYLSNVNGWSASTNVDLYVNDQFTTNNYQTTFIDSQGFVEQTVELVLPPSVTGGSEDWYIWGNTQLALAKFMSGYTDWNTAVQNGAQWFANAVTDALRSSVASDLTTPNGSSLFDFAQYVSSDWAGTSLSPPGTVHGPIAASSSAALASTQPAVASTSSAQPVHDRHDLSLQQSHFAALGR